uniref:IFT140 first beta-propeller domain-containing protein n=1 Tax=Toxoplasma gondii COUG TaxID=1074873 RepID=A0A2G8XVZ9_TOXGO|nr:hypothetical protein TGCOUG_215180 [Toxoplasma gondii COUG]
MSLRLSSILAGGEPTNPRPAWSGARSQIPLLAVSTENREVVLVVTKHGETAAHIQNTPSARDGEENQRAHVSALRWHPQQDTLFIGWTSGRISWWDHRNATNRSEDIPEEGSIKVIDLPHSTAITHIAISPKGELCVSIESSGTAVVSSVGTDGSAEMILSPSCEYHQQEEILFSGFRCGKNGCSSNQRQPTFFLTENSRVVYEADHLGLRFRRYTSTVPLLLVDYVATTDRLVLLTDQAFLIQLALLEDGPARALSQTNVAWLHNCVESPQFAWIDENILASVAGEQVIRFWNMATEESHVLSLHAEMRDATLSGDVPSYLAFRRSSESLLVGTKGGRVARCRRRHIALSSELVWEDFELIHEGDNGSCSSIAVFEGNDEAIAISGKATLSLLFWIEPAIAADAGLIAIQSGFTEISLFMEKPREGDAGENAEWSAGGMDTVRPASPFFLGDSLPSTLSTRFSTRQPFTGLTINKSMLVVFSTQLITVFKVTEDQGSLLACPVSCIETLGVTGAVAYFDGSVTTLFVATPRGVLLMSLEGQDRGFLPQRHAMDPVCPHSPAPKHIWLKGDTLGVMSTDNCISVWRLGKGAPALLSTEKVEASCTEDDTIVVKSITGAKDGSRISFILQRRKQKNYRPDSAQNLTLDERGNLPVPLAEDTSAECVTEENAEEALGIFDVSTTNFWIYGLEILRGTKLTFHQWDERDVRLLVCCVWRPENPPVADPLKDKRGSPRLRQMNSRSRPYIVTFFIDHDGRLAEQVRSPRDSGCVEVFSSHTAYASKPDRSYFKSAVRSSTHMSSDI